MLIISHKKLKFVDSDEMLSIVSVLSTEAVFVNSSVKKEEAKAARAKFLSPVGDHITLLNVFRCYRNIKEQKVSASAIKVFNLINLIYEKISRPRMMLKFFRFNLLFCLLSFYH